MRILLIAFLLTACSTSRLGSDKTFVLENPPTIGQSSLGQVFHLGGFSGLVFEGRDPQSGDLFFTAHTDRGPNISRPGGSKADKMFPMPGFQLRLVRLRLSESARKLSIDHEILLTRPNGQPLGGLPNKVGSEIPFDASGKKGTYDPSGSDAESLGKEPDGSYWMGEEYRPALLHLTAEGKLLKRYVPKGTGADAENAEVLPAIFAQRNLNLGFEALAIQGPTLYAFLQSPLGYNEKSRNVRVLAFDTKTRKPTGQYVYVMHENARKMGDATIGSDGKILALEQNSKTGVDAHKRVYTVDFSRATDVTAKWGNSTALEDMSEAQLAAAGVVPAEKSLLVDLTTYGYDFAEKAEGLAFVPPNHLAVANDNDFGIHFEIDAATGFIKTKDEKSSLFLLTLP